jgi:hypothetical protein
VLDQKMNAWAWELRGHKNIGNKNIKVIALSEPAVEYIALIKKGKLLPVAEKYLDNSDYLEILKNISLYKSGFGDKIKTLINSFDL